MNKPCQKFRILDELEQRPWKWFSRDILARIGADTHNGKCSVRSRIADLRKLGCNIEQRTERGTHGEQKSFYRLMP